MAENEIQSAKFAFVVEGEVFWVLPLSGSSTHDVLQRLIAGLKSDPVVIDITNNNTVSEGDIWDGISFSKPV